MSVGRKAGFRHSDAVREKIRVGVLLERLMANALADQEFMTSGQIKSAEILLRKAIPDLSSTDLTANVTHHMVARMPVEPASVEDWEKRHIPHVREH